MPYKDELKVLETFLNENLEHHYKYNYRREDCILGPAGAFNTNGVPYITYAREVYLEACNLAEAETALRVIKKEINRVIDGLYASKSMEKPEGGSTAKRPVNIHWRQFPEVYTTDEFDRSPRMIVRFRLVVSHK